MKRRTFLAGTVLKVLCGRDKIKLNSYFNLSCFVQIFKDCLPEFGSSMDFDVSFFAEG